MSRTLTPRQSTAIDELFAARERIAMLKAVPCTTATESKERWDRLRDAERAFKEAFCELDASIVDAMGGPAPEEECTCLTEPGALCPKCHAGYGR